MRRILFIFVCLLFLVGLVGNASAISFKGKYGLKLGYWAYAGGDEYWDRMSNTFEMDSTDFNTYSLGLEGTLPLTSFLDLSFGVDYISKKATVKYDSSVIAEKFQEQYWNADILYDPDLLKNDITLSLLPVHILNLKLCPFGKDRTFIPYVGVGFSLFFWWYEENGWFSLGPDKDDLDNDKDRKEYFITKYDVQDDGAALSFNFIGGIEVPLGEKLHLSFDIKYLTIDDQVNRRVNYLLITEKSPNDASVNDVNFVRNNDYYILDLSGLSFNFGISYKF